MEPQQQKVWKKSEGPAPRGPRRPRRYLVRVRGDVPDDLGLRVAELHAAALATTGGGPPPMSPNPEKSGGDENRAGTEEDV